MKKGMLVAIIVLLSLIVGFLAKDYQEKEAQKKQEKAFKERFFK
jgi:general stress protein CsbA